MLDRVRFLFRREIPLTKGKVAIVDAADYPCLAERKWYAYYDKSSNKWYAMTGIYLGNGKTKIESMHRIILGINGKRAEGDHIDNDGLNNRRSNLRIATHQQNGCNRGKERINTSGHKGVTRFKRDRTWKAQIGVHGRNIHLGYFSEKHDAAKAYQQAAQKYHGEFARSA